MREPASPPSVEVITISDAQPYELDGPLISERLVDEHRNVFCLHYDRCLDLAVMKGWRGFSCQNCHHITDLPPEVAALRRTPDIDRE